MSPTEPLPDRKRIYQLPDPPDLTGFLVMDKETWCSAAKVPLSSLPILPPGTEGWILWWIGGAPVWMPAAAAQAAINQYVQNLFVQNFFTPLVTYPVVKQDGKHYIYDPPNLVPICVCGPVKGIPAGFPGYSPAPGLGVGPGTGPGSDTVPVTCDNCTSACQYLTVSFPTDWQNGSPDSFDCLSPEECAKKAGGIASPKVLGLENTSGAACKWQTGQDAFSSPDEFLCADAGRQVSMSAYYGNDWSGTPFASQIDGFRGWYLTETIENATFAWFVQATGCGALPLNVPFLGSVESPGDPPVYGDAGRSYDSVPCFLAPASITLDCFGSPPPPVSSCTACPGGMAANLHVTFQFRISGSGSAFTTIAPSFDVVYDAVNSVWNTVPALGTFPLGTTGAVIKALNFTCPVVSEALPLNVMFQGGAIYRHPLFALKSPISPGYCDPLGGWRFDDTVDGEAIGQSHVLHDIRALVTQV